MKGLMYILIYILKLTIAQEPQAFISRLKSAYLLIFYSFSKESKCYMHVCEKNIFTMFVINFSNEFYKIYIHALANLNLSKFF